LWISPRPGRHRETFDRTADEKPKIAIGAPAVDSE